MASIVEPLDADLIDSLRAENAALRAENERLNCALTRTATALEAMRRLNPDISETVRDTIFGLIADVRPLLDRKGDGDGVAD